MDIVASNRDSNEISVLLNLCDVAPCPADLDSAARVDVNDLLALLGAWGACGKSCPEDLDDDGSVDAGDLGELLKAWGPCD